MIADHLSPDAPLLAYLSGLSDSALALGGTVTRRGAVTLGALRAWAGPEPEPVACTVCDGSGVADCPLCDGSGLYFDCRACDRTHDCGPCDGSGRSECGECTGGRIPAPPSPGRIGDAVVDRHSVARLAAVPWPDDTPLAVETRGPDGAISFTAPGGVLAIAAMRGTAPEGEALDLGGGRA